MHFPGRPRRQSAPDFHPCQSHRRAGERTRREVGERGGGKLQLPIGIELVLVPVTLIGRATLQGNGRSGETSHTIWDVLRIVRYVAYGAHCDRTLVKCRRLAMADGFMGPHPNASWAASVCDRIFGGVDASIYIGGTVKRIGLFWNVDAAVESTIGVIVE